MKGAAIASVRTLQEIVRARSLAGLAVFIAILAWGSFFIGSLTFGSRLATAVDLALAASGLFAAVISILLAVEHGSAATGPSSWPLLASGVTRGQMLLGRWAGVAVAAAGASAAPPLLLKLLVWVLAASTNPGSEDALAAGAAASDLATAGILLPLESVLLVSIACALSVALPRTVALALAAGIWAAGHLHPDPLTFVIVYPGWTGIVLRSVSALLPDLELYNARVIGTDPDLMFAALIQSALFIAGGLLAGLAAYRRRDL